MWIVAKFNWLTSIFLKKLEYTWDMTGRDMTGEQNEFINNHFFKNYDNHGWDNIARKLIKDGKCIVAGNSKLWHGGIGNFIKCAPAENAIGCSLLTFDKESFLQSAWFKEQVGYYLKELTHQIDSLQDERYAITNLL